MTHLYIELNGITEEVNSLIIEKLYNLASSGDLDETSDLKGRLHLNIAYRAPIDYLTSHFPDLYITTNDYAIPFEDSNMLSYLLSLGIGSNGYITETQAAAATIVANSRNTEITKFNELKYFTNITSSKGGINSVLSGNCRFYNWTALEEVDISNFESIGHNSAYAWEDTFKECAALKKVTASNKLTFIGFNAFDLCVNLEDITGLSGDIYVASLAFKMCRKLKQRSINNVSSFVIGTDCFNWDAVFQQCYLLTSINLSFLSGIDTTGSSMFEDCTSLQQVTGLSDIVTIKDRCFRNCSQLTTLDFNNVEKIGTEAFRNCTNLTTMDLSNVTEIKNQAFDNSGLSGSINLSSIVTITTGAFVGCNGITSCTIGPNVSFIDNSVFRNCKNLQTVVLPNTLHTLPSNMFSGCSKLTSIDISNITSIGYACFLECTLLLATLDLSNVTSLGENAFYKDPGIEISNLPKLSTLPASAFTLTATTSIVIPKETLIIDRFCFSTSKLTSISFESGTQLSTINQSAFDSTQLLTITLPEGVTTLGNGVFTNCKNLTRADLPSTTTSIGSWAFQYADSFTTCICRATMPPTLGTSAFNFGGWQTNLNIYVPDASVNSYKAAANWSTYASVIKGISQLPNS